MLNGKGIIIHLIVELIKKTLYKKSQYFPKPSSHEENIKDEIDLTNYATKKRYE